MLIKADRDTDRDRDRDRGSRTRSHTRSHTLTRGGSGEGGNKWWSGGSGGWQPVGKEAPYEYCSTV